MKSVKPGRGPSRMSGLACILVGGVGILFTIMANRMGAGFLSLIGVFFVIFAVMQGVYHLRNANGANRYSLYDITEEGEEPDPGEGKTEPDPGEAAPQPSLQGPGREESPGGYCPYCGKPLSQRGFSYCPGCGKKLPL